ncbi:MAG: carbamate kinase [Armatimonadota bacterium]|nr:carbamate kinase [Armatimonadota bacterium]MDR7485263.1 carbamate kinase [Armatimonadota bacterium]MDR7533899.1 carbamate kinase [Armatimonadota bacterium]MDR7537139.1 carbamate kinase [Armatimonadota bacterium]
MRGLAVVAVGGNSLVRDNDASVEAAREALAETCAPLAAMAADGWALVITHGNGPQVGFGLLRAEAAAQVAPRPPLDVLGAETQGAIGYLLQQALGAALAARGVRRTVATVVTQVVVDPDDPAFRHPTKPIGPFYHPVEAEARRRLGWVMVEDAGRGWRRVVPSPEPVEIVEGPVVRALVERDVAVIAAGGGGIPVVRGERGYVGVEGVIDKDLAAAVLARTLGARLLVISTAVEHVALYYGTPRAQPLGRVTLAEARRYLTEGHFPPGSMGPKITAAVRFLEAGGQAVIITAPWALGRALAGETGTQIVPDSAG